MWQETRRLPVNRAPSLHERFWTALPPDATFVLQAEAHRGNHESDCLFRAWWTAGAEVYRRAAAGDRRVRSVGPRARVRTESPGLISAERDTGDQDSAPTHSRQRYRGRGCQGWCKSKKRKGRRTRDAAAGNFLRTMRAMSGGRRQQVPPLHLIRTDGGRRMRGVREIAGCERRADPGKNVVRRSRGVSAGFHYRMAHGGYAGATETCRNGFGSRRRKRSGQRSHPNCEGCGRARDWNSRHKRKSAEGQG